MRGCLLGGNREIREYPGVDELEWENPVDKKSPGVLGGALSRYKKKIRSQGANIGCGREGVIP